MWIKLITKEEIVEHSDVEEMAVVGGQFHKSYNKATCEDADVSQVDINFRLTTLVEGEGKIFQGKGILCKYTETGWSDGSGLSELN